MNEGASQGSDFLMAVFDYARSAWDWMRSRLFALDERTRLNLLLMIFNLMLLAIVIFALLNRRTEIIYKVVVQTATAAQATATAGQARAYSEGVEEGATRAVAEFIGQLTATASAQPTATPTPATPTSPPPTVTFTPVSSTAIPTSLSPPTPTPLSSPVLRGVEILGCDVTLRWNWSGVLAEDEWFSVRVGRAEGEPLHGATWTKEDTYVYALRDGGEYNWEIAICRGDPAEARCEQLAVSERGVFEFPGCPR